MEKIVLKKEEKSRKTRRHSVIVTDETYIKICQVSSETNIPVEKIVNRLLEEALKNVEIQECGGKKDK